MTGTKILVVEDDANLLVGIRDILELEGYSVLTAANGLEGLEVLQAEDMPPGLIVSDIMMPNMDGIEFLEKVRLIQQYVSIPFIYLTARGEKADIQRAKRLGVDDYVVKPFNADDLLVAVRSRLDRHRAIAEVQQGEQDELKKSILTILNHEFRTPLTFVVAYSDMLTDVPAGGGNLPDDSEMITFLEGVRSGADRLRRLIENFILLVEIQTGSARKTFEWRSRPVDNLDALVHTAVSQAQQGLPAAHTTAISVDEGLPAFRGDEEYLKAALVHLLDNAYKFTEDDTPVNVRVYQNGAAIKIEVEDGGRGIPPAELDNVWNSFYQINRAHFEDQGVGSGLAIVRGVAALHGGEVTVNSEPGVGSKFAMVIPLPPTTSGG